MLRRISLMSQIREILQSAQAAETRGEGPEAGRLLREAAAYYRDRQMLKRAAQMLRQARRVEGVVDDAEAVFGFESEEGDAPSLPITPRRPELAAPTIDAWCSFCCRPTQEVGPLVSGPTGSYLCAECTQLAGQILQAKVPVAGLQPPSLSFELPAQRRARLRFAQRRPRLGLVLGPQGTGKSTWVQAYVSESSVQVIEIDEGLRGEDAVVRLSEDRTGSVSTLLVVRAEIPQPAMVLRSPSGDEPVYGTDALVQAVPQLSARILAQVDAIFPFAKLDQAALLDLGGALAQARGISLGAEPLAELVSLSLRADRGAHELAVLLARIAPGEYLP